MSINSSNNPVCPNGHQQPVTGTKFCIYCGVAVVVLQPTAGNVQPNQPPPLTSRNKTRSRTSSRSAQLHRFINKLIKRFFAAHAAVRAKDCRTRKCFAKNVVGFGRLYPVMPLITRLSPGQRMLRRCRLYER